MSNLLTKKCLHCSKSISKKSNCSLKDWNERVKYCSKQCLNLFRRGKYFTNSGSFKKGQIALVPLESRRRGSDNNKWKGGKLNKVCAICSNSFKVDRYRFKAKTCSMDCNKLYRKSVEFRQHLSEVHRSKISERMKGFTETVGTFKRLIRTSSRYDMWRDAVLKRDDYTCQMCEVRGGKLCVDHIEPFITIIARNNVTSYEEAIACKELWDINNGRTLCRICHYKTPTFGSKVLKLLDNNQNHELY